VKKGCFSQAEAVGSMAARRLNKRSISWVTPRFWPNPAHSLGPGIFLSLALMIWASAPGKIRAAVTLVVNFEKFEG